MIKELEESCWYRLGALSCFGTRVLLSLTASLLMVLVGVGATIAVRMVYDYLAAWWVGGSSTDGDSHGSDYEEWASAPVRAQYQLRRSRHLNALGLLDLLEDDAPNGGAARNATFDLPARDLPPSYDEAQAQARAEAARAMESLPSYSVACSGLNRVLPGGEEFGTSWV